MPEWLKMYFAVLALVAVVCIVTVATAMLSAVIASATATSIPVVLAGLVLFVVFPAMVWVLDWVFNR